ncbi:MAG: 8-oxo-dGTP diphosphatase MutT [Cellvibrionaceae bacterium]
MSDLKRVYVAAGVILSPAGTEPKKILLAKRPIDKHQGGLWEFPGGKVDVGETVQKALCREIKEELDIQVLQSDPLIKIHHDYSDKSVTLDVWLVSDFTGAPQGAEGQDIRWVLVSELDKYEFPAANVEIVEKVKTYFAGHRRSLV